MRFACAKLTIHTHLDVAKEKWQVIFRTVVTALGAMLIERCNLKRRGEAFKTLINELKSSKVISSKGYFHG